MRGVTRMVLTAVLGVVAVLGVGCKSTSLGVYNVRLQLDEQLRASSSVPTIEVDMIALSGAESDRMKAQSVREYFAAGNLDRASFRDQQRLVTRRFGTGSTDEKLLETKDPIWRSETWKSGGDLFVMASVPGAQTDLDRRLVIPRQKDRWPAKTKDIVVRVRSDRLELVTQPLPAQN